MKGYKVLFFTFGFLMLGCYIWQNHMLKTHIQKGGEFRVGGSNYQCQWTRFK